MIDTIVLDEINIEITWKNIKNLHLRVYPPNGVVRMTAPLRMKLETIRVFAVSKIDWIKRQQKKIITQKRDESIRFYVEGESHYLWGKHYFLKVDFGRSSQVQLTDSAISLTVRVNASFKKKQSLIDAWYREQVKMAVFPLLEKWQPLIGVKAECIYIQKMKTRWGTCNTRNANIRFNSELAKKPMACLEYVVVHELVHLLEPSHNHRFKALMDKFMPDWRIKRALLKKFHL